MKIDFIQLESVDSTNTWAKQNAHRFNSAHLTCITAHEQTAGRGRQDKKWISPKKASLYMSLFFTTHENAHYLSNLGQIMALTCAEFLRDLNVPALLKWPNDIVVEKKKIGGVLTETFPLKNEIGVVLGLGLNVNLPENILKNINQPATSLHLLLHKELQPLSLVEPLLNLFTSHLKLLQSEGFAHFHKQFNKLLAYKGEMITVHLPQESIHGICDSITSEGLLKLQLPSGEFTTLSAGEIL